jgi:hypothetical protein
VLMVGMMIAAAKFSGNLSVDPKPTRDCVLVSKGSEDGEEQETQIESKGRQRRGGRV